MSPARHALIIETAEAGKSHGINRIHWIETDVLVRGFAYCDTREPNGRKAHISGQFLPDLLWCHGESFESRHDSFCTMKTGAASVFLRSLVATSGALPDKSLRAVPGKSNSNEKKNEALSIAPPIPRRADYPIQPFTR